MKPARISQLVVLLFASACSDGSEAPTAASENAVAPQHSMDHMSANVTAVTTAPFTVRAPLEPYRIQQLPDFQIHSKATSDIVMQQSVFNPGSGPWHTHPGPSFVYVIAGEIKLERYNQHDGCTETPVYVAGQAYFEVAEEVHRAVVMSATPAVVLVTRFNIPVGGMITKPAADPGCAAVGSP
jgi:quercetin dioxygenase-like cupin family protein